MEEMLYARLDKILSRQKLSGVFKQKMGEWNAHRPSIKSLSNRSKDQFSVS
jgi:hypothetical protein